MPQEKVSSDQVVKSSVWYTLSSFLLKGLGFITAPIFARLMTKTQMGEFSNYLAWFGILEIIFGFSLEASLNRARFDFPGEEDQYSSSILVLGGILALAGYGLVSVLYPVLADVFHLEYFYVLLIFTHLFFQHAYTIVITRQRITYRYKKSVALSLSYLISATLLSLLLVIWMEDKFRGRAVGQALPMILFAIPLYYQLLKRGRCFRWDFVKYAFAYCWPFVPHLLALSLLSTSDRIMITNMVGNEANATYSIANTCVSVATLFFTSLNTAIAPWVFDQLEKRDTSSLRRITLPYVLIFILAVQVIQLAAPEILLFIGGWKYLDAKNCFLPLFSSVVAQFCYTLYVNIEQYSKKTWAIASGTLIAAGINVILNFILIPQYGYVAAAYTTLIGYLTLFAIHYTFVRIIGYKNVYNDKVVFLGLGYVLIMQPVIQLLYQHSIARYAVLAVMLGLSFACAYRNREFLLSLFRRKKTV